MREQRTQKLKLQFATATLVASAVISFSISALATAGTQKTSQPRTAAHRLRELRAIDQLKEAFQRDAGKVRLVALVSPT